ncbi:hypothetical protein DPMN_059210 [Dreissena polymorpha]|uniref:Uncharacterized protein n=1 Tax=Dreissena polymorpha TaxID=45954 RepID=A0A9D4C354_DREPO|nr:hypothetical protein DPMN_059210 [Dreissena polymorpha]
MFLTKFHEYLTQTDFNVNIWTADTPLGDIIKTNVPTIFNEDDTINVTFRMLTRKTALSNCGDVFFQRTGNIFELNHQIYDVFKHGFTIAIYGNGPALGCHVFQRTKTFFKLNIIGKNGMTTFHENRTIHVASSVNRVKVDDGRTTNDRQNRDHKRST